MRRNAGIIGFIIAAITCSRTLIWLRSTSLMLELIGRLPELFESVLKRGRRRSKCLLFQSSQYFQKVASLALHFMCITIKSCVATMLKAPARSNRPGCPPGSQGGCVVGADPAPYLKLLWVALHHGDEVSDGLDFAVRPSPHSELPACHHPRHVMVNKMRTEAARRRNMPTFTAQCTRAGSLTSWRS